MGGWVVGSAALYSHFVAPSCKLELARFSALLRIQDGARVWQKGFSYKKTSVFNLHTKCYPPNMLRF